MMRDWGGWLSELCFLVQKQNLVSFGISYVMATWCKELWHSLGCLLLLAALECTVFNTLVYNIVENLTPGQLERFRYPPALLHFEIEL